jgi:hypothetical protein
MSFLRFAFATLLVACGGDSTATTPDAGQDAFGHKNFDAQSAADTGDAADANVAWDRMTNHGAGALGSPHLRAIYVGIDGIDLSPSFDSYISFLVSSPDWWGAILAQYGVQYGTYDGASFIPTSTFIHDGDVVNGFINWAILDMRVHQAIHATLVDDAGADSGAVQVPHADAYVVFLPDNVNVDLGQGETTCANAGGYHSYDTDEPYAIIPPCGRSHIVISHEVAEMVTDPEPGAGWFSDADEQTMYGGEIGDLCNFVVHADGQTVTALWSNKDGDCEPQP